MSTTSAARWAIGWGIVGVLGLAATGCGKSEEAARVTLEVAVSGAATTPVETDLGYTVTLEAARYAIDGIAFTTGGETHEEQLRWMGRLFVGAAHAHPGHHAGGAVIGELGGAHVLDFASGESAGLGEATLLAGRYDGANLRFGQAGIESHGLASDDALLGGSVLLRGTAERHGITTTFEALITQDADREVVGLPFDANVAEDTSGTLVVEMLPAPAETGGVTLFDAVDFHALDADDDGHVSMVPGTPDNNRLLRATQRHDFYRMRLQ